MLDIRRVDLVDQTVDALLQRLPGHALILLACLVGDLRLQRPQPRGRDVRASRPHIEKLFIFCLCRGLLLLLGSHGRRRSLARWRTVRVGLSLRPALAFALTTRNANVGGRHY